jgi:hypothetical protein
MKAREIASEKLKVLRGRYIGVIGDLSQTVARSKRISKSEWFFGGAMNNIPVAESSDLGFEPPLPDEYFPLWRCIACGAMGNSNPARPSRNHLCWVQTLRTLVGRLAWVSPRPGQWQRAYRAFQDEAIAVLEAPQAASVPSAKLAGLRPAPLRDFACGQIEAPQTCLGVCIRPIEE